MKKIGVILIMSALLSCEKVSLITQTTSIKDSKVEEINKENKDIKTKNSGVGSNLILPSATPKPVITPVPSVIPVVVIPTALPSTSTSNSSSSQSSFVNPVSSPKASNTTILPIDPDGLPPRPPQANLSNGSAGPSISFADQPLPNPPNFSEIKPLPPETLKDGKVELIFRDNIKIRREATNILIITDTVKFKSLLTNVDLNLKAQIDNINQIMKDFDIKDSEVFAPSITEKEASEDELLSEKFGYDIPNVLSRYIIVLKNKDMASLITKLRPFYIVRSCNYDNLTGSTSG